jgi:hypothetical protein
MSIDSDAHFIRNTPISPASGWESQSLLHIANLLVPDIFFREQKPLLKADQTRLWLRWFLEGLATPLQFVSDASKTKLHVFEVVLRSTQALYPSADQTQKRNLADAVTEHLYAEVLLRRSLKRDFANQEKKRELLENSKPPRCYLCGYSFTQEAQDKFLRVKGRDSIKLPMMLDVLRPRGLIERDLTIEVEHLVPVAAGGSGGDNLRLACGWCNRFKGAKTSLYDAAFSSTRRGPFRLGGQELHELPEPFWIIRLAANCRCQHLEGCGVTSKTGELYVAFRDWHGSPNPTNLKFYCADHDPVKTDRFMDRAQVERLWKLKN